MKAQTFLFRGRMRTAVEICKLTGWSTQNLYQRIKRRESAEQFAPFDLAAEAHTVHVTVVEGVELHPTEWARIFGLTKVGFAQKAAREGWQTKRIIVYLYEGKVVGKEEVGRGQKGKRDL